jgi:5-methyltetrahydrofolate--homocysteine methyltransferase
MCEAFPQFSMDLGAGSMALYLGAEPIFAPETLWFQPFLESYEQPLRYDPDNIWWQKHLEILRRQVELAKDTDIACCIPDIVENIDILSALRDPQTCCFDLYDCPEDVKKAMDSITKLYPIYYDAMYDIVKREDRSSAFTAFNIVGPGKTAKLQCDFAAMMSPEHFNEFIIPTLEDQCSWLDNTLFHLDGPECLSHVDAILSIEKLGGLQWTHGARNPRSGDESWFPLYKKVKNAEKGLWITLMEYTPDESIEIADQLVKKFGHKGFLFMFPYMDQKQGEQLMIKAEKDWKI